MRGIILLTSKSVQPFLLLLKYAIYELQIANIDMNVNSFPIFVFITYQKLAPKSKKLMLSEILFRNIVFRKRETRNFTKDAKDNLWCRENFSNNIFVDLTSGETVMYELKRMLKHQSR